MVYYYILIIIFRENKILLQQEKENKHNKLLFQGFKQKTNDWVWRNHFFGEKIKAKKRRKKMYNRKNNPQNSAASNSPHSAVEVFFIRKLLN